MTATSEAEAWRQGLAVLDDAFARARFEAGEALPCRQGCSSCCESAGLFDMAAADAALLLDGLSDLDEASASRMRAQAEAILDRLRVLAADLVGRGEAQLADWEPADGLTGIPSRLVALLADGLHGACPVLDDRGSCGLHAHRPAICRMQGLAWQDAGTGDLVPDECRMHPGQEAVPARQAPLLALDELREDIRCRLAGGGLPKAVRGRTFVAAVVAAGGERGLR